MSIQPASIWPLKYILGSKQPYKTHPYFLFTLDGQVSIKSARSIKLASEFAITTAHFQEYIRVWNSNHGYHNFALQQDGLHLGLTVLRSTVKIRIRSPDQCKLSLGKQLIHEKLIFVAEILFILKIFIVSREGHFSVCCQFFKRYF